MRAAKGTKVTEFVEAGETSGCTGLDTTLKLSAMMVPIAGTYNRGSNTLNFRAPKGMSVTLIPYDANKVSVSPGSIQADGAYHPVVLTGVQPGSTKIGVFGADGNLIGDAFQVDVKPERDITVGIFRIIDPTENLVPTNNVPSQTSLQAELDSIFPGQANIRFTVQQEPDHSYHYDVDGDRMLHFAVDSNGNPCFGCADDTELFPLHLDILKDAPFSSLKNDPSFFFTYYVNNISNQRVGGFSQPGMHSAPAVVRTDWSSKVTNYVENLTGHELGHVLGRGAQLEPNKPFSQAHNPRQGTLMYHQNTNGNPCQLLRGDWNTMNFVSGSPYPFQ